MTQMTPTSGVEYDAKHSMLDPTKVHVITLSSAAPDAYVRNLGNRLSEAGIFAIILTDPKVKIYSTFPVQIAQRTIDVSDTDHMAGLESRIRAIVKETVDTGHETLNMIDTQIKKIATKKPATKKTATKKVKASEQA